MKKFVPSGHRQENVDPGPSTHSPEFLQIVSLQTETSISQYSPEKLRKYVLNYIYYVFIIIFIIIYYLLCFLL